MTAENRRILKISDEIKEVNGEEYVVLQNGSYLLKKWSDIFDWFRGGRAPQDWLNRFDATAPSGFSIMARLNEDNTRVL